jgi:prepilin-type cleavage/methylation N-terminal domain protein
LSSIAYTLIKFVYKQTKQAYINIFIGDRQRMNNQKGFTLAEVLITLGIIGTVTALTLPALIQNHKKSETTARLKKFYSIMSQAVLMSENDNGSIEDWEKAEMDSKDEETGQYSDNDYKHSEEYFNRYLKNYLKYLKTEKDEKTKLFKVLFTDGSSVKFRNGDCMDLIFDINGNTKPNEAGRDQYRFLICKKSKSATNRSFSAYIRVNAENREQRLHYCKNTPESCSGLLEYDNWEIKKDYPHRL